MRLDQDGGGFCGLTRTKAFTMVMGYQGDSVFDASTVVYYALDEDAATFAQN